MTDPTPNHPPLWRVMSAAAVCALFDKANNDLPVAKARIAAELRAIADEAEKIVGKCYYCDDGKNVVAWL